MASNFFNLIAKPVPNAIGNCAPSTPHPPKTFFDLSKKCIEPTLPMHTPVFFAETSARRVFISDPFAIT